MSLLSVSGLPSSAPSLCRLFRKGPRGWTAANRPCRFPMRLYAIHCQWMRLYAIHCQQSNEALCNPLPAIPMRLYAIHCQFFGRSTDAII